MDEADGLPPTSPTSPVLKVWEADLGAEGAARAAEQRRLSASAAADAQMAEMEARSVARARDSERFLAEMEATEVSVVVTSTTPPPHDDDVANVGAGTGEGGASDSLGAAGVARCSFCT